MNKLRTFIILLILILQISGLNAQKLKLPLQIPKIERTEKLVCHTLYCFVYNENHEQAEWVAYKLTKEMTLGDEPRDDNFKQDPEVETGTADVNDYKSSGYDRGHLAPAADMCISEESMEESFLFSNISPQLPGFNRGMWKTLESELRNYAQNLGSIYVVTGPILKPGLPVIGQNEVSVPAEFYKAVLFMSDTLITGIAFIMPNKKIENGSVYNYAVSIDMLEEKTEIDFFPALPYFLEKKTEKQIDVEFWKQYGN
jgi:endonuclease G